MNTVIFAEEGSASIWGIGTAPPDQRRVGTIEQREGGFYVSPEGPATDSLQAFALARIATSTKP